jgi:hypothetical protein
MGRQDEKSCGFDAYNSTPGRMSESGLGCVETPRHGAPPIIDGRWFHANHQANLPSANEFQVPYGETRLCAGGGGRVRPSLCARYEILHAFRFARGPHSTGYARP